MFTYAELKPSRKNVYWRKALLGARLIIKARRGPVSERDRRLGRWLKEDPGVTDRLLDQAIAQITAVRKYAKDLHEPREGGITGNR